MLALIDQTLQSCNKHSSALTDSEINLLMPQLNGWIIQNNDGIKMLTKTFNFNNFSDALKFANLIGQFSDSENHHPCICIEWGQANISWWTHIISGLFINDFIMAAKCDAAYEGKLSK